MSDCIEFSLSAKQTCAILVIMFRTQDLHVKEIVRLLTPRELKAQSPTTDAVNATVARSRERIIRILRREDPRLLVVIGPCSIHDEKGALDYADAAQRAARGICRPPGNRHARLF